MNNLDPAPTQSSVSDFFSSSFMAHESPISGICANPKHVGTGGYDNQVIVWDSTSKKPIARGHHDHLVNQVAFSASGDFLLSSSSDGTARRWSLPDLQLQTVYASHLDDVEMITEHPTADYVATACRDTYVRIFSTDGSIVHTLSGHTSDVLSVTWAPNGVSLYSSGDDGKVIEWNSVSGELLRTLDLNGIETDTVIVGPNNIVYAGTDNGTLVIFCPNDTISEVPAHDAGIKRLVLDRCEQRLASLGYDGIVNIWSIDHDGDPKLLNRAQMPPDIWARSVAFLDDSTLVFGTFGSSYAQYDLTKQEWDLTNVTPTQGINALCLQKGTIYYAGDSGVVYRGGISDAKLDGPINFLQPCGDSLLAGGHLGTISSTSKAAPIYVSDPSTTGLNEPNALSNTGENG